MVVENLCLLAYKGITQVEYTDNRPKELLDYFLEGSMGLEVIGKIKMLRTEGMVDEGIVLLEYRLPDCNPQTGTGDLCKNDASKAKAVQKITEKIDFSKFKTYKSNEVPLSTVGTIHDFCRIDGKQTAYLDFAYQLQTEAAAIRNAMDKDVAELLANSVGAYPNGDSFNPFAPKTLPLYAVDNTVTPPLPVVNSAALSQLQSQLKMAGAMKDWKAIGGENLDTIATYLAASPVYGRMDITAKFVDAIYDIYLPKNPTLNRVLTYFATNTAIVPIIISKSFDKLGTIPLTPEDVEAMQLKALVADTDSGDRYFPVTIGGLTYDVHVKWKKCKGKVDFSFQMESHMYLYVPPVTDCSNVGIVAYDTGAIADAAPIAPTPAPSFDALCLQFSPITSCSDYVSGDYTLTLPDSTVISGTSNGNAYVNTSMGLYSLIKSLFAKEKIGNLSINDCGGYQISMVQNSIITTLTAGDTFVLNYPCVGDIAINVVECTDCNCEPSEARISSFTKVYSAQNATLDITPVFALTNDSIVSHTWALISGTGTVQDFDALTCNITAVDPDTSLELTLTVVTAKATIEYRIIYGFTAGVMDNHREHYITSNATTVSWSTDSNDTTVHDWSVDSSVNGLITSGTAAVNAMSGSFAYVKASPTDKLSFRIVGSTIWAQAGYFCQPAPVGNKIVSRSVAPAKAVAKDAKQTAKPTKEANKK